MITVLIEFIHFFFKEKWLPAVFGGDNITVFSLDNMGKIEAIKSKNGFCSASFIFKWPLFFKKIILNYFFLVWVFEKNSKKIVFLVVLHFLYASYLQNMWDYIHVCLPEKFYS